jgi:hypothetical protein
LQSGQCCSCNCYVLPIASHSDEAIELQFREAGSLKNHSISLTGHLNDAVGEGR